MGDETGPTAADEAVQRGLLEWLKNQHSVDLSSAPLRISHFPGTGRGLQATRDIAEGEEILRVPFRCFVSEYAAISGPNGNALHAARAHLSSEMRICLHLIAQRALATESRAAPYIRSLPEGVFTLDAASPEELRLLQHPMRRAKVERRRRKIAIAYQRLKDIVAARPAVLPPGVGPEVVTAGAFLWAYNIVGARAFSISLGERHPRYRMRRGEQPALPDPFETCSSGSGSGEESESDESEQEGVGVAEEVQESETVVRTRKRRPRHDGEYDWVLIPFADMFNYAHDGLSDYEFEPGDGPNDPGEMVFRVGRAHSAGEQVFLRYNLGMGAFQFAKHYGFVPAEGTALRDHFPVRVKVIPRCRGDWSMLERAKDRVLEDFRLSDRRSRIRGGLEGAELTDTLLAALRVRALAADEFASGVRQAVVCGRFVSVSNELNVYAHLSGLLRGELAHYDTTLRHDADLLAAEGPYCAKLCVAVRRADKALLASALLMAQNRHRELAAAVYAGRGEVVEAREAALRSERDRRLRQHAAVVSARIGAAGRRTDVEGAPEWVHDATHNLGRLLAQFAAGGGAQHADAAAGVAAEEADVDGD
eukprot:Hpha_TRINITY_DN17278_c0_g1::TRINITY_DN17278_c0_g1_i1::g.17830::m.17830